MEIYFRQDDNRGYGHDKGLGTSFDPTVEKTQIDDVMQRPLLLVVAMNQVLGASSHMIAMHRLKGVLILCVCYLSSDPPTPWGILIKLCRNKENPVI